MSAYISNCTPQLQRKHCEPSVTLAGGDRGWKRKYREQRGCIRILIAFVIVLVLAAICDAIFIGIVFNKTSDIHEGSRLHRFCIEARGDDVFAVLRRRRKITSDGGDEQLEGETLDNEETDVDADVDGNRQRNAGDARGLAWGHFTVDETANKLHWRLQYRLGDRRCGLWAWHLHGPLRPSNVNARIFKQRPTLPIEPADQGDRAGVLRGSLELDEHETQRLLREPESFYLNFRSASQAYRQQNNLTSEVDDASELDNGGPCRPRGALRGALDKICPNPDFHPDDDDDDERRPPRKDDDDDDDESSGGGNGKGKGKGYGDDDDDDSSSESSALNVQASAVLFALFAIVSMLF